MIRALMESALNGRVIVLGTALALVMAGVYSFANLDIEAYPDPVQPMVEVLAQPGGLSAEEVEKLVTVPLEIGLAGMRDLEAMRSISLFGLSDIRCYFTWDSDYYWDRVETINRINFVTLPQGVAAGISPENSIGEIYRYQVSSPDHDLMAEKEIEDWVVEKQLKTVDGVIDVSGFGGLTRQYHVDVDAQKLDHYQIPLSTLISFYFQLQYQRRRQLPAGGRPILQYSRSGLHSRSRRHPGHRAFGQPFNPNPGGKRGRGQHGLCAPPGHRGHEQSQRDRRRDRADAQIRRHASDTGRG